VTDLWLPGKVVPKARPRFAAGGAYLPARYRDWLESAADSLAYQDGKRTRKVEGPTLVELIFHSDGVDIRVERLTAGWARGPRAQRGDIDNLAGAVMDALVRAGILEDDAQVMWLQARLG
jgi:Holliday junction resolvase RusA-like endonuclease